jgi:hypothetical protein
MRLRITKTDECQFLTCLKYGLWGSNSARFKDWKSGDYLAIIVDKALAGLSVVSGSPFVSKDKIWDNGLYPHRIPIKFQIALNHSERPPVLGEVREVLTSLWGPKYGWGILNQQIIEGDNADIIIKEIKKRVNGIDDICKNLDQFLEDAIALRKAPKIKAKRTKVKNQSKPQKRPKDPIDARENEPIHTKAQSLLIKLGKITGCSVWIATNDKGRSYKGKPLGDGCIKKLPSFGLNQDATQRISLIDIIWIKQNAPVCAFEVEATTSIYSGILRMSDLLAVVPAINIKLFIVGPRERQDKVLGEINRPTFQKIGLNEYCKFITIEDLENLIAKVDGMHGHVQPSIVDTIAIENENEIQDSLG